MVPIIVEKTFPDAEALCSAGADLLAGHIGRKTGCPHAVLLSGGQTPLPMYARAADSHVAADSGCYVLYTDERMVPADSPQSNYGNTRGCLQRMGMREDQVLRVDTALELQGAAREYGESIARFLRAGGRITLGFLGLGADGHTASLFSLEDVKRGAGGLAMAVPRAEKPDRVSVTPDLLKRVEMLIFVVTGSDKSGAVARLRSAPESIPAGLAVREARHVQLWTA